MSPIDRLIETLLRWLARELVPFLPPRRPGPVFAYLTHQEQSMLVYEVAFPAPGAFDVKTRKLAVNLDGTTTDHEFGVADASHQVRCEAGQVVILTLVDIDGAGNASLPSDPFTFTAADTLAPPQPGALGASLVAEEPDTAPPSTQAP